MWGGRKFSSGASSIEYGSYGGAAVRIGGIGMRPEHWLYTVPLRLRSLFRRAQADQELDDELRDHLDRASNEYLAKGMTADEAPRLARLDLGGVEKVKEECRDARRVA